MAVADSYPNYEVKLPKYVEKEAYFLGLAEKNSAAKRIAGILDKKSKKVTIRVTRKQGEEKTKLPTTTGYFVKSNDIVMLIVPASGHLLTLKQDGVGWQYPVYDFKWVPNHIASNNKPPSKYDLQKESALESIRYVAQHAADYVIMTDYDEEGEVIGGILLAQLAGEKTLHKAKRMKFSSFAKNEILESLEAALEGTPINFGMYNRGLMRHYLDWLWGINLSRALMLSLKNTSGQYLTLSTGRVQGPTLSFIAERQRKIDSYVPIPYFKLFLSIKADQVYDLDYTGGSIEKLSRAEQVVKSTTNADAEVVEISKRKRKLKPPTPYNLSKLQDDAYRYYKMSGARALRAAQSLYLNAAISYPRTSSEKYPSDLDHKKILTEISKIGKYKELASKLAKRTKHDPVEGKKKDPAHPCIYPTGTPPEKLNGDQGKVYNLVIHRYFATFGKPAQMEYNRIDFDINSEDFYISGKRTVKLGWKRLAGKYGMTKDEELPDFKKGETYPVNKVEYTETFTRSPPYYNPSSLRKKMEDEEIGTKATRAGIIESLYNRKYFKGDPIEITPVGEIVNEVLKTYSSQVISVELSRKLERMGDLIEASINENQDEFSLADAVVQGVVLLHDMLDSLQDHEEEVGTLISKELSSQRKTAREIGPCQSCKKGTLKILTSSTSGKRFVGCTEYFNDKNCTVTFPLPQSGRLEPMSENCKEDDYPQVKVYPPGKRPWTLCLNPDCPIRAEYERKKKEREAKKKAEKEKETKAQEVAN